MVTVIVLQSRPEAATSLARSCLATDEGCSFHADAGRTAGLSGPPRTKASQWPAAVYESPHGYLQYLVSQSTPLVYFLVNPLSWNAH